ncbi:MAG: dTMP kinase [Spirochaetales bacterium]|jgi:dTMP kinase|nr:dTMP kinase [Spirochaetales bacterium]
MILKNFIVLEGLDGAGTTTQAKLLIGRCLEQGIHAGLTREPTDHAAGLTIRTILRKQAAAQPQTLAFLFAADRNEHIYSPGGIRDMTGSGQRVICDRYLFSSLAYQSVDCGWDFVRALNDRFPLPEILIFLDIQPCDGEKRLQSRQEREIFEFEDFQIRAAAGYKRALDEYAESGMRILSIDAARDPQAIHREIWDFIFVS